jgi:hypothetical protein
MVRCGPLTPIAFRVCRVSRNSMSQRAPHARRCASGRISACA